MKWICRLAFPLGLVVVWQIASAAGWLAPTTLAAPSAVAEAGWAMLRDGTLAEALAVSLRRIGAGLAIGCALGLALGVLAGLSRAGEDLIDATMQMLRTVPFLAIAPLLILWLGVGESSKVALVALGAAFPLYLNTFAGIRGIDARLVEAASAAGAGRLAMIREVFLPGALPSMLLGLRYALAAAVIALVVAEQINASAGIGAVMSRAREFLQTDVMVLVLVVYALLGLAADVLVRALERWLLRWRTAYGGA